jgi:type IV pilus assembly protein PilV
MGLVQHTLARARRHRWHGYSLLDALIALALLSFGLLGLTRLQTRTLAQATEAQSRATAAALADELTSSALVDVNNRNCYTLPASGTCASATASTLASSWATRVASSLPSGSATSTYTAASGQLQVVITWTGKSTGDTRSLTATTDVR